MDVAQVARRRRSPRLWVVVGVVLIVLVGLLPVRVCRAESAPVSIGLTGWGWCLAYRPVGDVTVSLNGTMIPRSEDAPEICDLYLAGELSFNLPDRTDSFALELRGTKVRSLFFLRQVTGGESPVIAEFEGTWLSDNGTNYVACEGRLAVPVPNHVAKPYIFVLRSSGVTVPAGEAPGNYVSALEAAIWKGTSAFDTLADGLADAGQHIKELIGDVLTRAAVVLREVRKLGTPYFI